MRHLFWRSMLATMLGVSLTIGDVCAQEPLGWLRSPSLEPEAPALASQESPLQQELLEAVYDLTHLYRHTLGVSGSEQALALRMRIAADCVKRLHTALDLDEVAPSNLQAVGALLLRLRALEEMVLRFGYDTEGLQYAAMADSLEDRLRLLIDPIQPDETTALALAAGLWTSQTRWDVLHPALYEIWRKRVFESGSSEPAFEFLLFHVLAPRDPRVLDDLQLRTADNPVEATLKELSSNVAAGRLATFASRDPGRRLLLAVRYLVFRQRIPANSLQTAERITSLDATAELRYQEALAALDSLELLSQADVVGKLERRAVWVQGGNTSGSSSGGVEEDPLALACLEAALHELRGRFGARLLTHLGMRLAFNLEPTELVPGQQAAAHWSLVSSRKLRFHAWRGRIDDKPVAVQAAPEVSNPDETYHLRSNYTPVQVGPPGSSRLCQVGLRVAVERWGEVEIQEQAVVHSIAPVQASLDLAGSPLLGKQPTAVAVHVSSRSPLPIEGSFRIAATANWQIEPARSFNFTLRRPGQSVHQELMVGLPHDTSPGSYKLTVRMEVGGQETGNLRTTLIKPVEWVVIGPLTPPHSGQLLAPERGVNLEAIHPGKDGRPLGWLRAPIQAYDVDGALDLHALYDVPDGEHCACAFTVLESTEEGALQIETQGVERIIWNGSLHHPGQPAAMRSGRNTLLVRSCNRPEVWRLWVGFRDLDGEPSRVVDNDLSRLLDGFDSLREAVHRTANAQAAQRLVTLNFSSTAAQRVAVLGAFNAWVPLDLEKQPDGSWRRELLLPPGRYAYKMLVDGHLRPDPKAIRSEPDGFGGRNSLLIVR